MKNVSVWSRSRLEPLFLPGAGADPNWSESETQSRLGDLRLSESETPKKVAAPQHWYFV